MSVNIPVVALRDLAPEAALRRLELAVGRRIDGLLTGDHVGALPGPGSENADARLYQPGQDDVRRIDWNVTARTTDVHVRDAMADRELETWALVDASASMDFGTAAMEKRDVAAAVTVALACIASRSGDAFGAYAVGPYGLQSSPLRSGRAHQLMVLRALCAATRAEPGMPSATLADGLVRLARHRRRGMRIVVSDLLDPDQSNWALPLRRLAATQRVLVVEVVDPRELDLPAMGYLTLVDPETGRTREVDTGSRRLRERFARVAREHRQDNATAIRATGAAHLVVGTDGDWLRELVRFIERQRRLRLGAALPAMASGGAR
ncbi:MAG TPA: DUF58 domain-containing protein [Dermatophilaceae bacterium]|nr:DUF58 domain-containing protein [Dermatophilaceae bacterium]